MPSHSLIKNTLFINSKELRDTFKRRETNIVWGCKLFRIIRDNFYGLTQASVPRHNALVIYYIHTSGMRKHYILETHKKEFQSGLFESVSFFAYMSFIKIE